MRYSVRTAAVLVLLAGLAIWFAPDFLAGYAYALGKVAMFVACVSLVDNVLFKSFDTSWELRWHHHEDGKERPPNLAYAIYLASVHLGIALCIYAL